jgi:hypothetical protein
VHALNVEVDMSVTKESQPENFVAGLVLPEPDGSVAGGLMSSAPMQDKQQSAAVAGNALLAFTADVSAQHKTDLLNSIGIAQLSAVQKKLDPARDPIGYYEYVTTTLSNIGYTAQSVNFSNYNTRTKTVEVEQVVLEIMANVLTAAELTIVKAAVTALKAAADSGGAPWTIYNSKSTSSDNGSFSIGLANETNGSVAVKLAAFHFKGTENSTKLLWMSYSSTSVKIQDGNTQLVLNDAIYGRVRDEIDRRMGEHAAGYLANLPL